MTIRIGLTEILILRYMYLEAIVTCSLTKKLVEMLHKPLNVSNLLKLYLFQCIHRKIIEGYLDSVPSLAFNTIKTKLIMLHFIVPNICNQNECLI